MNSEKARIERLTANPAPGDKLEPKELREILDAAEKGMATINGDTAPVTITVRQLAHLLAGRM